MKKRIFSILIALAFCLTLLPITAWAIDYSYPSKTDAAIGSTTLTSGTYYLINTDGTLSTESASAESYNIYYSTDDETGAHSLTLNNANLKSPIYVSGGTTITLVGNNVCGSETSKVKIGIQGITPGSITITGTGSYTAYSSTTEGIVTVQSDGTDAPSDIVIQGGTISLPGSSIDTRYGGITITGGANVEAKEISTGGDPNHDEAERARPIVITGTGTKVKAERIDCLTTITVSGSAEVTAKSTSETAMSAEDGITIEKDATVTATGKSGGLNSFGGSIVIEGTATATVTGQPVQVNGGTNGSAAVSVGTNAAPTATRSITVKGKLTVESTFAGIWTWGTGDITIDGGEVSVNAPYGIMTRMATSTDATGGNVTIKSSGKLTINGAMGTYPQASNCTLTVDNSTVDIATSAWGLYWPGQIVLKDSTVTCTNSGSSNKAIGTAKNIQYDYTDNYKVTAGDSASAAELIPHANLTGTIYQSNYVKIEPVPSYSITVTGGSAQVEKAPEGATVTITATVPEGQRFVKWTSDDDLDFADETAEQTTFTMPASDVTVTAVTTSTAQEAPSAAPELAGSTTSSITLKEVASNDNGAAAEYGISTDGGTTWAWQASPEFTGLASGTEYTFAVRYGATENGNYVASPASDTAAFSTTRPSIVVPVTPTYPPAVEDADNGTVSVVPANPRQGSTVTVTPNPDKGYEVAGVTVTDSKGNPVAITDNGDGTFSFIQPAGKVTISVVYVCDGLTDNCPSYHLADVDTSAWYHLAVDFVVENSLMSGYGNGSFGPNDTLTRAELAQILYNKEERPSVTGGSVFTDVADSAWYGDAVTWAAANGIVGGYGNGRFGPGTPITREQLAVMLWRYAGCPAATQKELRFTDADQVSHWAWEAMLWATENGIINGYSGILNPRGTATRAEAAQMLMNFMENS